VMPSRYSVTGFYRDGNFFGQGYNCPLNLSNRVVDGLVCPLPVWRATKNLQFFAQQFRFS
jgi:hypothetical protein